MKSSELIRWALTMTGQATEAIVRDMKDAPMTQPTSSGGNHPVWVLGHLSLIEGYVPGVIFGDAGKANPVAKWEPLFASGSQPTAEPSRYPSFDEVLGAFRESRAESLRILEEVGETGLDRAPKAIPPGFENEMKTVGQTLLLMALHNMVHYGQVADARRAAGRAPLA
jgi:hypothetical protein